MMYHLLIVIDTYLLFFIGTLTPVSLKTVFPTNSSGIPPLASSVFAKYFSHLKCSVIINENCVGDKGSMCDLKLPLYSSKVFVLLDKDTEVNCYAPVLRDLLENLFEYDCTGFIVQLSKPECFLKVWKDVAKLSLHRYNPRVFFLPTPDKQVISPDIAASAESGFIFDWAMVDFYFTKNPGSPEMLRISNLNLNKIVRIVGECFAGYCPTHLPLFHQDKISNLEGKVLNVATFNYPPYAVLEPLDGTEMRIVFEYARLHNCSIEIVTDSAQWGQINENGTGNGILGNVVGEKADVGLGALYLWYHEYKFLDFSVPYIRTGVTCLVPRPQLLSTLLLPIRPFNTVTWFIVVCTVLGACVAIFYIKKLDIFFFGFRQIGQKKQHYKWFTTKEDTLFRTFGFLVLQASSNRVVETSSVRHLVHWLHITYLLVAATYSSGLASILTVPSYLPPIDTVSDLVSSELQWGATHDAWIFSLREASEPHMQTLVSRFRTLTKEQLYYNSLTSSFAFSIERLPAGHFAVGDYITEESMKNLRLMKQDIYYEHCILVFQKRSPYLKSFNHLIHRLIDSGLLLHWEGEVARKFLNSRVQSALKDSTTSTVQARAHPTTIQLRHVQGAFIILGVGLTTATFIALFEIYMSYKNNLYSMRDPITFQLCNEKPYCYGFHK